MSLVRSALKLNALKPTIMASRQFAGGHNHVIIGPPTVKIPPWKQYTYMGTFVVAMFTYPFYVTYMMYEWDKMEDNL